MIKKAWDNQEKGFRQENDVLGWAGSPREQMEIETPEKRIENFDEVVKGYTIDQAI